MIQFIRPNQVAMLDLRCRIYSQNLNELEAIKELEFNFRQGTSPPFVPDLDYDQ